MNEQLLTIILATITVIVIPYLVWLTTAIYGLRGDISTIKTIMVLTSDEAAKILHSPHTPDLDKLLEKLYAGTLTLEEGKELEVMCCQVKDNHANTKAERWLAVKILSTVSNRDRLNF